MRIHRTHRLRIGVNAEYKWFSHRFGNALALGFKGNEGKEKMKKKKKREKNLSNFFLFFDELNALFFHRQNFSVFSLHIFVSDWPITRAHSSSYFYLGNSSNRQTAEAIFAESCSIS